MQATKAEKTRLGIFIFASLALLAIGLISIVGMRLFEKKVSYFARFEESVGGLEPGSAVKQNGVTVGSVSQIGTDPEDVRRSRVELELRPGTPVKEDMEAALGNFGITGMKFVEISGGSYNSRDLDAGGEIKTKVSSLGKLGLKAESIAEKIDTILSSIVTFTSAERQEQIAALLTNFENLSASLAALAEDMRKAQPGERLTETMVEFELVAKDFRKKLNEIKPGEINKAVDGVVGFTDKLNITLLRTQNDLTQSMSNLRETMKNMNDFSRQIKDNPAVLLRGEDKRERKR